MYASKVLRFVVYMRAYIQIITQKKKKGREREKKTFFSASMIYGEYFVEPLFFKMLLIANGHRV